MNTSKVPNLALFPLTAEVNRQGHLVIGGCDVVDLVKEFGTPLYLFDESTLRRKCREFKEEFGKYRPNTLVIYASKAFLNKALALILKEEGLGLDVVSGGELSIARSVDFPLDKVYFHGNNKTPEELNLALDLGVGRIVVDNFYELELLDRLAGKRGIRQNILLRLTPGVDPHTHRYTTTGTIESKFGFAPATGQAEEAVNQASATSHLNLLGLHFHLGSPVPEIQPYELAIELVLRFAREMGRKFDFNLSEFDIGGGFAVPYTLDSEVPTIADYARTIIGKLNSLISELGLSRPRLIIEPGRAIVGQAGVALYKVGAIKEIRGIEKYVCVDGGMSDNIRPALYGAKYEALLANKALETGRKQVVTIAGKLCESGDILVKDTKLASAHPGHIIAIPVCGAYSISMSSNYNATPRPAIVMVKQGQARLVRRRETYQDLMSLDLI
ncbi:MAG: diaminopimelate decarboxylase [Chloroflexi bacterium RBG_13_50_10]|nr:MAG: diaminopimelate decarboxylase [Chloroflexi bacterium RBG_13_50_10]